MSKTEVKQDQTILKTVKTDECAFVNQVHLNFIRYANGQHPWSHMLSVAIIPGYV